MDIDNIPFVPHDEVNGLVRLAAEALQHGARPVDNVQIAFDVGYQDSHYFSYLFKKHVGVSPREFRSRAEEG